MPTRSASAQWDGTLKEGNGRIEMATGAWEGPYSWSSRFEEAQGTNPEELIAAAHAGCFSMKFAGDLGAAGFDPTSVRTTANVRLEKGEAGWNIVAIELDSEAQVDGIDDARFQEIAEQAKAACPVSKALAAVPVITVNAKRV
ncbi:MAG TPA: OsmC family protein [Actinomycetota bacterium]|nr:OsmC family protein [Actinomycetota bacterium]